MAGSLDDEGVVQAETQTVTAIVSASDIALFDLHDPALTDSWPAFLATTPMLNGVLLPASLQDHLANTVATYRSLTPDGRPTFFVVTYFDLLSERLLAAATGGDSEISPMQICPVFVSGAEASVSKLLAVASGLPEELFVHATGQANRYRDLFLQTELSHCRFLATTIAAYERRQPIRSEGDAATPFAELSFEVGESSYTAILSSKRELRALLETVGDADAITAFKRKNAGRSPVDETDVLTFIRLLSLLATDGRSGYAAIPVLLPQISEHALNGYAASKPLRIADALEFAYQARELFGRIVPFAILDTQDLLTAQTAVVRALADAPDYELTDERFVALLNQFVTGSNLLLATNTGEKMPLINY